MHLIDRWKILDTGSTDNTVNIINKVLVGNKKGELYQEPFINFKASRNRLLDLAGEECKFTLMLDDTYIVESDLIGFLNEIRGDQVADSFTLYIKSDDVEYGSNRVLKTTGKLRYMYKIHEVVQDKNNIITPYNLELTACRIVSNPDFDLSFNILDAAGTTGFTYKILEKDAYCILTEDITIANWYLFWLDLLCQSHVPSITCHVGVKNQLFAQMFSSSHHQN